VATEAGSDHPVEAEERVTPLELFFDLVFVFAITQVTAFIADDPTWAGLARGLLILGVVWWAWAAYAWLTNTLDTDEGRTRVVMFISMAAMFVVSLSIPGAFDDHALLFACAYFFVRAAHILLYGYASNDVGVQSAVKRLAPSVFIASALLMSASLLDGVAQGAVWAVAIAIDYAGPVLGGMSGWTLHPGHFAERHGLIIIIAFGESIVATGIGAEGVELDAGVVVAATLGVAIAAALWWAYFDVVALVAERHLREATGLRQLSMARDSYSYIHLAMIAGIVLLAVGGKKTIADVGAPLETIPAVALCGGVALYLLGHIAFRLRNVHTLNRQRLATAVACLALIPLAMSAAALVSVALIAVLCGTLILYEVIHFREARERVRAAAHA
jgi:low temperature requirement protein LtrA